jgi:hypothetical protein
MVFGSGEQAPFLRRIRWSRGSDPRLLRLTMGGLLDRHNWVATPCIKDHPRPRVRPSHFKTSPPKSAISRSARGCIYQNRPEQFNPASRFGKGPAPKRRGHLRRPIRLSLPRWLRYADSRDGLGGMPDRSPAHICGGPPKYLRQKSPERDTRF